LDCGGLPPPFDASGAQPTWPSSATAGCRPGSC